MRIGIGKVNKENPLFGRVMRHANEELCPVGSYAFMLLSRFEVAGEKLDFSSNKAWFDVKLMVEQGIHCQIYSLFQLYSLCKGSKVPTKAVSDKTYARVIKSVCAELGIPTKHFLHIGRAVGLVTGEMLEAEAQELKNLGNWNPDVVESYYSAKIPLRVLRLMAGHSREKGLVFLPRAGVKPSEELLDLVFPWASQEMEKLISRTNQNGQYATAINFLRMLLRLRTVILQDAAVFLLKGKNHYLFTLPVFSTPAFLKFQRDVAAYISSAKDPQETSLSTVVPGITSQLHNLHTDLTGQFNRYHDRLTFIYLSLTCTVINIS
jgi:hypothetical protein